LSCSFVCVADIFPNSLYVKRRQFGRGHRMIRRKPGTPRSSGWLGVELVFAGLVVNHCMFLTLIVQTVK